MPEKFVTCHCQHCAGGIEFDSSHAGASVACPHCGQETILCVPPPAQAQAVKGTILDYTIQTNAGIISGDDGKRYSFKGAEWRDTGKYPAKGMRVDFLPQAEIATSVYLFQDITGTKSQRQFPAVTPKKGALQFQNPENGFVEEVSNAPLFVLLFGCFYFAAKGVWTHAVAGFLAAFCTCGLSWLIYPFFADQIMRTHYLRKGWVLYSDREDPTAKDLIGNVITVPPRKRLIWLGIICFVLLIIILVAAKLSENAN
jgi:hypothetical protein